MKSSLHKALVQAGKLLVNQEEAEVLVEPRARKRGFWFGGGNMVVAKDDSLWLVGRYRNSGDSRTGLEAGPRGAELALMRSTDDGETFQKEISFGKSEVAPPGERVQSIEGASLMTGESGVELYVSSEKERSYPDSVSEYQKAGTGVWSIDVLTAPSMEELRGAEPQSVFSCDKPCWLHVKDPVVREIDGRMTMIYCSHPFSWGSTNTGYARLSAGEWINCSTTVLKRGPAWDVAIFRVTECLELPSAGILRNREPLNLYFYDGGECLNEHGSDRPVGFSCEEIGGLAAGCAEEFPHMERLSMRKPLFVSPHGTGCSRYVSICEREGYYLVTWQQSQPDESQPLVINRVSRSALEEVLSA